MPARWNTLAMLALLPSLAIAAPATKSKPKKPKKPAPADTNAGSGSDAGSDSAGSDAAARPDATAAGAGTGSAAPDSSTPAPGTGSDATATPPAPDKPAAAADTGPDVDSLRQEYLAIRDELFKSRARANAVASQLYSTRIQVRLTYASARYYNPAKASIRLDGASIYENTAGAIGGDDGIRFDGYVAPGRHLITFHVEATGKDDDSFTSTTESQIVIKAVAGKDLIVAAKAKDTGDIAYEWKRSEKGSYGLGIDVSVATRPVEAAGGGKK